MSYKEQCRKEVRALVWKALDCCMHDRFSLAMYMGVDESSIRNWRDGKSIPLADHYLMLCRFVELGGEDDSLSDFEYLKDFVIKVLLFFVENFPRFL